MTLASINQELKKRNAVERRLIYTAVHGSYEDYVPLWKFCAQRIYPDADIKCDVIKDPKSRYHSAVYRLLNRPDGDHDLVYVTDVDLFFIPWKYDLWEWHKTIMETYEIPFSNSPRQSEQRGPERLTGLHMATKRWYDETEAVRKDYLRALAYGDIGHGRIDDELNLMMICRGHSYKIPQPQRLLDRHFGIHFGVLRDPRLSWNEKKARLQRRVLPEHGREWIKVLSTPEYKDYHKFIKKQNNTMIMQQLYDFEKYARCVA